MTKDQSDTSPPDASVDDMAASIAARLRELIDERESVRSQHVTTGKRLKWLAGEIDKAERMTRSLIPRARRSTSTHQAVE